MANDQSNKQTAVTFLRLAATGRVCEAYQAHVAANFRHHNPHFRGDARSLRAGMEENVANFPNKTFDVQRVLEDGDLVAVHSRIRLEPGMPEIAVVHIFRFESGRIAEMWDVGQPAPAESANENGMF
jgi:predicted SnoaL-like aldol condensation-catalyzing enzyme